MRDFPKLIVFVSSPLRFQLNNLKQGLKHVLEYFIEMKALWDEIIAYQLIPSSTCPHPYKCEAMRSARNYILEDQIFQFLIGLNE